MAEQEVIKHTKKIYKVWNSKEHSLWHKVKEFLIEIIVIVFAITVSIWFHNRSEHSHQQTEVKQFLLGLKADLQNDLEEMESDSISYESQQKAFRYITSVKLNKQLNEDSLNKYANWIFNTTALQPNNGRFEGFKSSGKIGLIENAELQNDIMDLYQENIVSLLVSANNYITNKRKLFDYVSRNRKRLTDSTTNTAAILSEDEAQNMSIPLSNANEVLLRYDGCITKMKKIILAINKEYDTKE